MVYVDDMRAPFGRMVMCHMIADTRRELMEMADRIGVARKWIQRAGSAEEHFDIALSKRAMAVAAGAREVGFPSLARMCGLRRRNPNWKAAYFETTTQPERIEAAREGMAGCDKCGHLACVCVIQGRHAKGCKFRIAATCAVGIECEHGRDCCPECDACTCGAGVAEADFGAPTTTKLGDA